MLLESDEELSFLGLAFLLTLHGDGLGLDLLELSVIVSIKYSIRSLFDNKWCRTLVKYLPDEILSRLNGDRDGVAESLELDPVVLLEELLAEENVEARVSLVGNVDDVGILSLNFLTLHSLLSRNEPL